MNVTIESDYKNTEITIGKEVVSFDSKGIAEVSEETAEKACKIRGYRMSSDKKGASKKDAPKNESTKKGAPKVEDKKSEDKKEDK